MNIRYAASAALVAVALLGVSPAVYAVPTTLSHQGRLTDVEGEPVTGSQPAQFTLYDAATGGEPVWQEEVTLQLAANGTFTVKLGTVQPLDSSVFEGQELWLEMTVESEALLPRISVGSVPYAVLAGGVEAGGVGVDALAPGVLDWDNVENVPPTLGEFGSLDCADGQVAIAGANGWECGDSSTSEQLTEAEVDAFVANNGFVAATCATTGEVPQWNGASWSCATIMTIPQLTEAEVDAFVANNGYIDTTCATTGEVLQWNGAGWSCADVSVDTSAFLTGPVADADVVDAISVSNGLLHAVNAGTGVGINTTSTPSELTVNGDIEFQAGPARFLGIRTDSGGTSLEIKAGGRVTTSNSGAAGGTLLLAAGNNNISQPDGTCPVSSSYGGNVILRGGSNVFSGACGDVRTGHIIFQAGDADSGTSPERMRILGDSGRVGIGTATPSYRLEVAGQVAGSGAYVNTSDARLKTNVVPVADALAIIEKIEGVRYDWKSDADADLNLPEGRQIGVLAQDLQKVLPEAVSQGDDGYYKVAYSTLTPVLVEGIKAQQARLVELESKNADLERRLQKLENRDLADADSTPSGLFVFGFGIAALGLAFALRRRN